MGKLKGKGTEGGGGGGGKVRKKTKRKSAVTTTTATATTERDRSSRVRTKPLEQQRESTAAAAGAGSGTMLLHFNVQQGQWEPLSSNPRPQPAFPIQPSSPFGPVQCLTWNTFSLCLPSDNAHQRAIHLIDAVERSNSSIIALQEVSSHFYHHQLLRKDWVRRDFVVSDHDEFVRAAGKGVDGTGAATEGVILLIRKSILELGNDGIGKRDARIEYQFLPVAATDRSAKGLIVCHLFEDGVEMLRVVTSHFSSLPSPAAILSRARQFRTAFDHCTRPALPFPPVTRNSDSSPNDLPPRAPLEGTATITRPCTPCIIFLADFNLASNHELGPYILPPSSPPSHASARLDLSFSSAASILHRTAVTAVPAQKRSFHFIDTHSSLHPTADPFLAHPTFGTLYPWLYQQSFFNKNRERTGKKRKEARIDRILFSFSSFSSYPSSTSTSSLENLPEEGLQGTGTVGGRPRGMRMRCTSYSQIGNLPIDYDHSKVGAAAGKDGGIYCSDHVGVLSTFIFD